MSLSLFGCSNNQEITDEISPSPQLSSPLAIDFPSQTVGKEIEVMCGVISDDGEKLIVGLANYDRKSLSGNYNSGGIAIYNCETLSLKSILKLQLPVTDIIFDSRRNHLIVSTGSIKRDFGLRPKVPVRVCKDCVMGEIIQFSWPSMKEIVRITTPGPVLDLEPIRRKSEFLAAGGVSKFSGFVVRISEPKLKNGFPSQPDRYLRLNGLVDHLGVSHNNEFALLRFTVEGRRFETKKYPIDDWQKGKVTRIGIGGGESAILPGDCDVFTATGGIGIFSLCNENSNDLATEPNSQSLAFQRVGLDYPNEHIAAYSVEFFPKIEILGSVGPFSNEEDRLLVWDVETGRMYNPLTVPAISMKHIIFHPTKECIFILDNRDRKIERMPFPKFMNPNRNGNS